jgi:hypothetical protein
MLRIVLSAVAVAGVLAAVKPVFIDPFASAAVENAKAEASATEQIAPAAPALSSTVRTPVLAGVKIAREEANLQVLARGFRPLVNVATIYRPRYSQPGLFALDDWR